jgi:hypothetical protein
MNLTAATWFTIGACIVYMVAVDSNVYPWLVLQSKRLKVEAEKAWFRVRYHPDSPWVRYEVKRNADRLAKELQEHYQNQK